MNYGTNIPPDGILRFTLRIEDLFRHVRRSRTFKKKVFRVVRAIRIRNTQYRGRHDWASDSGRPER